ncbi:MAG: ankyrin repeat domain-containing protein [Campylobacterota bacterium]|nr:ankyrin repeat domain-containing protein [Campylobacterota bacterium]
MSKEEVFASLENIVYEGDFEAFKAVFEAGEDLNIQNKYGWTPLHIANQRGATAGMLVQKFGRQSMIQYM